MRPIHLKISGLNSFRKVQEIDFNKLCETGVFGIFGSTGSGKSTILDAITLALYGTVERASNNTQGILNHAEEQLCVDYSFSLTLGSKRITYRAERVYRRSGERTVKATSCRLVEIVDGEETVLASKADEMTKKIEDILGLSVEDFTRAVVLPQGKFAEFLTIKPKDRRLMLERLFALEVYGRDLSARLMEQIRNTDYHLNGVEQRQLGLGDASAERVKLVELDLMAAIVTTERITKELKGLEHNFDEAKEIWAFQEQVNQIQEKETQLTSSQSKIERMRERLSLAERAETIRPLLEEILSTEERFRRAKTQFEDAETRLIAARLDKETTEDKWSEANIRRLESEPLYLRRLEQLEQAKGLEDDIQAREAQLIMTRDEYSKLDRARKDLAQQLENALLQKVEVQKQQQDVKTHLAQITVDPEQRTRVNASAQALEAYEIVSQQAEVLQRDLEKNGLEMRERHLNILTSLTEVQSAQESVAQLKELLTKLQQNPPVQEELLSERAQELERYRHMLVNIERGEREGNEAKERLQIISFDRQKLEAKVKSVEQEQAGIMTVVQEATAFVDQKRAEVKELELKNLAELLVENLVEGEACLVCGSTHHPMMAQDQNDGMLAQVRNELDKAARELQSMEGKATEASTTVAVVKAQLLSKQELEQNQVALVDTKQCAVFDYRQELRQSLRNQEIQYLNAQRVAQEANLTNDRLLLNQWKTDQEQSQRQLEDAQRKLTEVDKKQHSLDALIASTEGVGKEIQHRLNLVLEEQVQRKTRLDTLRGSIALAEVPLLQKRYSTWDETMRSLNQKLADLEVSLQALDKLQQRLSLEKANCELELQNLKTVGIVAARDIQTLKGKCDTLTEGKPALERILQVKQELALVTGTEETLKKAYQLVNEVWTQAEQTQAVSRKTLELSQEGFEGAQLKLEHGLKIAQFNATAEAQDALCEEVDRQSMHQSILAFQQDVLSLKQKREDAEARLMGRSLRPEEWLAWPMRLKEVQRVHTEAIEQRGAHQQRLEKLLEEHKEWKRLDQEIKALSHRQSLLKSLQTVLKGNAFVEFIAQEQLTNVSLDASERLKQLTNQRYALEVDAEGGFIMRDDANGGVRRPVSSLSGGETFLTALALALALSTQIQLRGESPLEFFFLDEGFGTLDANLLETVMNTLEKLHLQNLTIGIISHVPELKNRLARRLIVTPAEAGGVGSTVCLEMA